MVLNNNAPVIFTTLLNYCLSSTSFILYDNRNDTASGVFVRKLQFLTDSYIIIINSIQPMGQFGQEPEPSQVTGMALVRSCVNTFDVL
jgi:hypothetical protein